MSTDKDALVASPEKALEVTAVYRDDSESESSLRRPKVLVLGRSADRDHAELRRLLRRRLRLIATAAVAASVFASLQKLLSFGPDDYARFAAAVREWPDLLVNLLNVVFYGTAAGLLWRHKLPLVRTLRVHELLIFGEGLVSFGVNNWHVLNNPEVLEEFIPRRLNILASGQTLPWFFIIVAYGTLIPNSGRRSALAAGLMALLSLALTAGALAANSLPGIVMVRYLMQMSMWIMLAVAIAIAGSHRLEKLRQAAAAARRLGQYQLKERLGAGGMGEVYLAEHVLLRRPCAVKLIRPERAGDPQQLSRFEREVRTTATLSHPNTVQIFDYGHADDGTFYYAMEYLPGLTLEQMVERCGPLPAARVIHFLRQLCGSLREAHAVGLIHRDIKPGNVMICERGGMYDVAKLLDFGLVAAQDAWGDGEKLTQEGAISGTPSYMSPEQAGAQESVDLRSDIYSLGALAYFLLAGRPPFSSRTPVQIIAAHLYEAPAPLISDHLDVTAELQEVVLRCLAKNPADRFADVASVEEALQRCPTENQWNAAAAADWWRCHFDSNGRLRSGSAAGKKAP